MTTSSMAASEASAVGLRHDWQKSEVGAIYRMPLPSLVSERRRHRQFRPEDRADLSTAVDQDGRLPGRQGYCPQSAHYDAGVDEKDC
jgi:biotin synthase-like enzyme